MALRLLMLLVTVAVIYLMFLRSQTPTADLPPDLVQSSAADSVAPGASPAPAVPRAHSQYKEALDRAHAAARQMQAQHAEADDAGAP